MIFEILAHHRATQPAPEGHQPAPEALAMARGPGQGPVAQGGPPKFPTFCLKQAAKFPFVENAFPARTRAQMQ